MEPQEFQDLLASLDGEIASMRERRRQREESAQRLRTLEEQAGALDERAAALRELGARDRLAEVERLLGTIEDEIRALRDRERDFAPPPPPPPTAQEQAARDAIVALGDEIERDAPLLHGIASERVEAQFRVWALRWRVACAEVDRNEWERLRGVLRRAYAVIRDRMEAHANLPYIAALNPQRDGNWESDLVAARRALEDSLHREASQAQAAEALARLKALPAQFYLPEDPAGVEALKDAVRACAPFLWIRDEVAKFCAAYREPLGEEFAYLWGAGKKPDEAPTTRRRFSRREILVRVLNRMVAKREIGNSKAKLESVAQGVPGHDIGRAREGVEVLIKAGILAAERGRGETLVAVDLARLKDVAAFVEGGPSGSGLVDAWCGEETAAAAE